MPMELLSSKLLRTHYDKRHNTGGHLAHWCPACSTYHEFAVDRPFHNGAKWSWNGDLINPTFTPSMNIRIGPYPDASKKSGKIDVCHYFLSGGNIQYLADCTHSMAGVTLPLPDLPLPIIHQVEISKKMAAFEQES